MTAERRVTILNEKGLHVRPASALAQAASKFRARITVTKDGTTVDAKFAMQLLMLAAEPGAALVIRADGEDEQAAVDALARFVQDRFGMKDD
jgi:phosphocarrier protein